MWTQTELFLTFPPALPDPSLDSSPSTSRGLRAITLLPRNDPSTAGRFRVWLHDDGDTDEQGPALVWDRKAEGGFPELKVLKQRIRDRIDAHRGLGHSDRKQHDQAVAQTTTSAPVAETSGGGTGREVDGGKAVRGDEFDYSPRFRC